MGYLVNEFHLKKDEISKPNNTQMPVDIIYLSSYIINFKKENVFYQTYFEHVNPVVLLPVISVFIMAN